MCALTILRSLRGEDVQGAAELDATADTCTGSVTCLGKTCSNASSTYAWACCNLSKPCKTILLLEHSYGQCSEQDESQRPGLLSASGHELPSQIRLLMNIGVWQLLLSPPSLLL